MAPLKILYENANLLVVNKPAGISVLREGGEQEEALAELLSNQFPELLRLGEKYRYGIVHRLDKDTSGVLLVAKTKETLEFLQKQFKERKIEKKYFALAVGRVKEKKGMIEGKLGRSPNDRRKQKVFVEPAPENTREAITNYRVLEEFPEFTFLEVFPKTGRKHQVRAHLASLHHPIAGDKLYGFKGQPSPAGLTRQFLHAASLKLALESGEEKTFISPLPEDLQTVLDNLKNNDRNN